MILLKDVFPAVRSEITSLTAFKKIFLSAQFSKDVDMVIHIF